VRRFTFAALSLAVLSLAAAPWLQTHRTRIESEPFVVTAQLPEGWSVDGGRVVPPETVRSACRVSRSLIQDRDWKSVVAAAMREDAPTWRQLRRISRYETAEYHTTVGSRLTDTVYINLESMGVAIWRVEADNSDAGWQCRSEFSLLTSTLAIQAPSQ
jgi:hypothetical protein